MKILAITICIISYMNCYYYNQQRLLGLRQNSSGLSSGPMYAVCVLRQNDNSGVSGVVAMKQNSQYSRIEVMAKVNGLAPNTVHGFHIHQYGDTTNGCTSMEGHYNPNNNDHAGPNDAQRHVGDLGNVQSNEKGEVYTMFTDPQVSLYGDRSVLGRGCVVHEKRDDLGKGGDAESKKTGNAGGRLACGVVAIAKNNADIDALSRMK